MGCPKCGRDVRGLNALDTKRNTGQASLGKNSARNSPGNSVRQLSHLLERQTGFGCSDGRIHLLLRKACQSGLDGLYNALGHFDKGLGA